MKRKARERLPKRAPGAFPQFLYKSLDELEGVWGEPGRDATPLMEEVQRLHSKPLIILTDDELTTALQQKVGLPWTAELALVRLRQDPLRHGVVGLPGDVLRCALRTTRDDLGSRFRCELQEIATAVVPTLDQHDPDWDRLIEAYVDFQACG